MRTVISPAKNYENSLKRALLQRKKLHWPRLIWPTRYVYLSATLRETIAASGLFPSKNDLTVKFHRTRLLSVSYKEAKKPTSLCRPVLRYFMSCYVASRHVILYHTYYIILHHNTLQTCYPKHWILFIDLWQKCTFYRVTTIYRSALRDYELLLLLLHYVGQ